MLRTWGLALIILGYLITLQCAEWLGAAVKWDNRDRSVASALLAGKQISAADGAYLLNCEKKVKPGYKGRVKLTFELYPAIGQSGDTRYQIPVDLQILTKNGIEVYRETLTLDHQKKPLSISDWNNFPPPVVANQAPPTGTGATPQATYMMEGTWRSPEFMVPSSFSGDMVLKAQVSQDGVHQSSLNSIRMDFVYPLADKKEQESRIVVGMICMFLGPILFLIGLVLLFIGYGRSRPATPSSAYSY
jgi:hypothetical protein